MICSVSVWKIEYYSIQPMICSVSVLELEHYSMFCFSMVDRTLQHSAYDMLPFQTIPVFLSVSVWVGSLGIAIVMLMSPVITTVCRRKSPRLYAVIGGLVISLGCLFLAFSTQKEQLFISHCLVLSVGKFNIHYPQLRSSHGVGYLFPCFP